MGKSAKMEFKDTAALKKERKKIHKEDENHTGITLTKHA